MRRFLIVAFETLTKESPINTVTFTPNALKDKIVEVLDTNKAEDIIVVPLAGKSALADFMIIASGLSARHVVALSEFVDEALRGTGVKSRYEGKANGDWVLADLGDVIVHLFRPEVREFYNIEKIWVDDLAALASMSVKPMDNVVFQG